MPPPTLVSIKSNDVPMKSNDIPMKSRDVSMKSNDVQMKYIDASYVPMMFQCWSGRRAQVRVLVAGVSNGSFHPKWAKFRHGFSRQHISLGLYRYILRFVSEVLPEQMKC